MPPCYPGESHSRIGPRLRREFASAILSLYIIIGSTFKQIFEGARYIYSHSGWLKVRREGASADEIPVIDRSIAFRSRIVVPSTGVTGGAAIPKTVT